MVSGEPGMGDSSVERSDLELIEDWFTYHAPHGDQVERYATIRSEAKLLAEVIIRCCPRSADRTVALRAVRTAVMNANAAIAIGEAHEDDAS